MVRFCLLCIMYLLRFWISSSGADVFECIQLTRRQKPDEMVGIRGLGGRRRWRLDSRARMRRHRRHSVELSRGWRYKKEITRQNSKIKQYIVTFHHFAEVKLLQVYLRITQDNNVERSRFGSRNACQLRKSFSDTSLCLPNRVTCTPILKKLQAGHVMRLQEQNESL